MEKTKKKAVGIIAEYNPFHNGHKYHLQRSLTGTGAEISIAVISGNFTQRGNLSILDKWSRAEMAVKNGVNLVVEMPVMFACNNAGYFAKSGVEILENLGVDYISFGSESGNIDTLKHISREMKNNREEIGLRIKESVKEGLAYPRARHEAIIDIIGEDAGEIIDSPNNLLALEYLKYIKKAEPVTVKRQGTGYYDLEPKGGMASATGIRKMMSQGLDISDLVPDVSLEILRQNIDKLSGEEKLYPMLIQKILSSSADELNSIFGSEEGLGNKMKNQVRYWKNYDDMVDGLKSKRYTRTRIGRLLALSLMGIQRQDVKAAKNYIRVLAFDTEGSAYLKYIKNNGSCSLPIITNINKEAGNYPEIIPTVEKDVLAGDLFNFACNRDLYQFSEYVMRPIFVNR